MNRKILLLVIVQTAMLVLLVWALVFYGKDEYEAYTREPPKPEAQTKTSAEDGMTVVKMSFKAQQRSGIEVAKLQEIGFRPEKTVYGTVIGIDSLLDLRARYLAARADADAIRATLKQSERDYLRQSELNRDGRNVSDRAAQAAEAQAAGDAARLRAAEAVASNLRAQLRLQWSEPLAAWATEAEAPGPLQALIERREVLLSVTLPDTLPVPDAKATLHVTPTGRAASPVQARYVGPAAKAEAMLPGSNHFLRAAAADLRTDMRVTVSWHEDKPAQAGFLVPAAAIVWFAGKAWVYEQEYDDDEEFVRREIPTEHEVAGGWFVAGRFEAGDRVVVEGAQLLLSEEMKNQITNENND
jgi:hypothetical protein